MLLAGGEGRRMGGQDKGLVVLCGQPLIAHVVRRLRPQLDRIYISANRNTEHYRQYADDVFADEPEWHGMGPLAALATAENCLPRDIELVQLAACDMPLLPLDLVATLVAAGRDQVILPVTEQGPQPTCVLVPRPLLATVAPYLHAGGRSIRGWLASVPLFECRLSAEGFANANDPHALQLLAEHPAIRSFASRQA